jgi:hypothetical protein
VTSSIATSLEVYHVDIGDYSFAGPEFLLSKYDLFDHVIGTSLEII